jgi:hypothetical protein
MDANSPGMSETLSIYERIGSRLYVRSLAETLQLIQPWHADETGLVSLMNWHGIEQREMTEEDAQGFGLAGGGYGAYLIK